MPVGATQMLLGGNNTSKEGDPGVNCGTLLGDTAPACGGLERDPVPPLPSRASRFGVEPSILNDARRNIVGKGTSEELL